MSIRPLNYPGRIIVSVTDDIESKVIANYGGRRWKRITNFLRGVDGSDPSIGQKIGEEYVCLRESDIPTHTHPVVLKGHGSEEWMLKDKGGRKTMFVSSRNVPEANGSENCDSTVENIQNEYQISPLEYDKDHGLTIPHDNMPPYMEVYIWECVEATEDELEVIG